MCWPKGSNYPWRYRRRYVLAKRVILSMTLQETLCAGRKGQTIHGRKGKTQRHNRRHLEGHPTTDRQDQLTLKQEVYDLH